MEPIIDLNRHACGGLDAPQDIRLDVKSGEIFCVIGPSGSVSADTIISTDYLAAASSNEALRRPRPSKTGRA
jgi:hypothetical protein